MKNFNDFLKQAQDEKNNAKQYANNVDPQDDEDNDEDSEGGEMDEEQIPVMFATIHHDHFEPGEIDQIVKEANAK